tara:strand:- start:589 stop:822 length:234 start_codon:yes stop_codon:yes gene_type:complete
LKGEDNLKSILDDFENEDFETPLESNKERVYSFLVKLVIWLAIVFVILSLVYLIVMELTWGSAHGSGCWGFPGEDCS